MADIYDIDNEIEEKPFDMGLFRRMMKYFKAYRKSIFALFAFMLASMTAILSEPLVIRAAIDKGIIAKNPGYITRMGLLLLVVYAISFTSMYFRTRITNKASQGIVYDLRKELFEHIETLSFRFFDGRPAGKIISRVTNDVYAISNLIATGIVTMLSESLTIIGILVIIFSIDIKLSLLTIAVVPFLLIVLTRLKPANEKAWMKTRKTVAAINANMNETLQGIRVIHAFSRQKHNIRKFDEANRENYRANMKAIMIELLFWPIVDTVGLLGTCLVIWFGAKKALDGSQSIGTIIAFINYVWKFWAPLSAISKVYSQVLNAMASADRIFQILDTRPEIVDSEDAVELQDIGGHISFENVSFGYNPEDRIVLHNITFEARPGEILALVGPTGAGKSSIINLLMRFYDPTEGNIRIDGYDLRDIKVGSLRSKVGMVLQDSFVFAGSIRDNILFGKLDATGEEIMNVAKAVKVDGFAEKFKDGFDTDVEERGAKLSSGQRQLLAFARALIADPKILILDEATSAVDTETERHIQDALRTLFAGRTSIVIAHRLSTIEHADKIMVIDDGRIIETGTHAQLLANKGMYHDLYLKQFQDEEEQPA